MSHASEDKDDFVRPLAGILKEYGFRIWYDEFELEIGDSLRESIDKGLVTSRYGIVVLSPKFLDKNWTKYELNSLVAREIEGKKVILPIWHNVTRQQVMQYSPMLADKLALSSENMAINEIAKKVCRALAK
ncbi:toll/interleukin-1 receptor domain-containing protein [Aeromonas sp. QDB07]|uniref:toll/interleukin-1 receptor domain-containing protein n=1 Tax=Aeromonas sp. QDB07 TaxID=2989838 RepID=UPI0022E4F4DE|nr:toll/interleukin-1 receptor domain-containing protein [Aeromonas sp. QDB07]